MEDLRKIKARSDFEPYGVEIPPYNDTASNTHKFTGHERDTSTGYDYMHARYYGASLGRFMKPDPEMKSTRPEEPQSWNRYSYVENNPIAFVDPTGEVIRFSGDFAKEELKSIVEDLNAFTGNQYAVNERNELVLVKEGENSSKTATDFFNTLISSDKNYDVVRTEGASYWNKDKQQVELNPKMFEGAKYPKGFNPAALGLGSTLTHELYHGYTDKFDEMAQGIFSFDYGWTGPVVDFVNIIRKERNMPLRESYIAVPGMGKTDKIRFDHVNPSKPGKIYFVIIKHYEKEQK